MKLMLAQEGKEYIVQRIDIDDQELSAFLFSLGCYSGEPITVSPSVRKTAWFLLKIPDIA